MRGSIYRQPCGGMCVCILTFIFKFLYPKIVSLERERNKVNRDYHIQQTTVCVCDSVYVCVCVCYTVCVIVCVCVRVTSAHLSPNT